MDSYLQGLLKTGVLTPEQFAVALTHTGDNKKTKSGKRKRKRQFGVNESNRRKALRTMTKWMFDGELGRDDSPLFVKTSDGEKMMESKFLVIANQTILNLSQDPVIGTQKSRTLLVDSIRKLVKHRRSNIKNSRKPNPKNQTKSHFVWFMIQWTHTRLTMSKVTKS